MAKIYTYSMILAAVMGLMTIGGIQNNAVFNILSFFGFSTTSASTIATSYGWLFILATIGGAAAIGIASGFLGRSISESYILVPVITSVFAWFIVDWVSIVNYIWVAYPDMSWLANIIGLIFFVLSIGFTVALIQFWRGNDI